MHVGQTRERGYALAGVSLVPSRILRPGSSLLGISQSLSLTCIAAAAGANEADPTTFWNVEGSRGLLKNNAMALGGDRQCVSQSRVLE